MGVPNWTDQHDALLRELHARGDSYALIGEQLGRTKNSCISRAHKIGLENRKRGVTVGACRPRGPRRFIPKPRPQEVVIPCPEHLGFSIVDLPPMRCKFAEGDGPFTFCGQPCEGSWCAYHARIVYRTIEERAAA